MASNNWVVSGALSESGKPMLANDPHLEINRLPNVWYEALIQMGEDYQVGMSLPGLPGILIGRSRHLAWGATYSFMDCIDSWVEECRGDQYRVGESWWPFTQKHTMIRRKRKSDIPLTFYENHHGLLEGTPPRTGLALATRWSASKSGVESLKAIFTLWNVKETQSAMATLGCLESSFSWVIADDKGNIGFQMSGLCPLRNSEWSGLIPVPGWESRFDWRGFANFEDLPRTYNPSTGRIVTANHDLNAYGKIKCINICMEDYRARRIDSLLTALKPLNVVKMGAIQQDLISPQASLFLAILRPHLGSEPNAQILRNWSHDYALNSVGASVFEEFYQNLLSEVFGHRGLGQECLSYLKNSTGTFADFYRCFDRILLSPTSAWFQGQTASEIYKTVWDRMKSQSFPSWGKRQKVMMSHLLLGGRLPRFLGFDRGPLPLPGGRATIQQGQVYRLGKRVTSFAPTFRLVTDLHEQGIHSNFAGGASDRRFSKNYVRGLKDWKRGVYKKIIPREPAHF